MIANLWMGFDDRARPIALPDEAGENAHRAFSALGDPITPSLYRKDVPAGPRDYELWSMYFDVEDEMELLQVRNDLNADFPGQLRTIGAWWDDGRQVGTEFTYDVDGNITGTTGPPRFPLHTSILEYIPDIVTYDSNGDVVSTDRPTDPSDVNLVFGQAPRRFT